MAAPILNLQAIQPWDLRAGRPAAVGTRRRSTTTAGAACASRCRRSSSGRPSCSVAGWWLASGRAGRASGRSAVPLAVATAVPFILRPLEATWSPPLVAISAGPPAARDGAAGHRAPRPDRRCARNGASSPRRSAACVIGAIVVGIGLAFTEPWTGSGVARWALVGAIPLIPGLAAAGPIQPGGLLGAATSSGRLLESTEFAVAGATPLVALATDTSPYLFPFALVDRPDPGRRPVHGPAAGPAGDPRQLQRDLVVAATEAERARVAADIHDDALQELTLLVQRSTRPATPRAPTSRGRSPIDCGRSAATCACRSSTTSGVGPALDWLVLRIERLAGGEVRLERSDGTRPPRRCRTRLLPCRPGGAGQRGQARRAADRRSLRLDHIRGLAVDRRRGARHRPRRRRRGKPQKFALREKEWAGHSSRIQG